MVSSGMLRRVAVARTDISKKIMACIIIFLRSMFRLLVPANDVSSSPILPTLMMGTKRSYETSIHIRATVVISYKAAFFNIGDLFKILAEHL
jgi:hypothetical protein